ncbi:MAG: DEAD/DEAH box helicase [Candidatus Hodarchaeales archaeon]
MTSNSSEICDSCQSSNRKIYRCSKCGTQLCLHNIRKHECPSDLEILRRERLGLGQKDKELTKDSWFKLLERQKGHIFVVTIKEDLSFLVDLPYYPFQMLNAWIPSRRSHYKDERSRDVNVEEIFTYLEKEKDQSEYDRKFFYNPWAEEQFNIWERNWKKLQAENGYWKQKITHRPTQFILQFPHLASEDIKFLKKSGCKLVFEGKSEEKIKKLARDSVRDYNLVVKTIDGILHVKWNEPFNRWFHSLFRVFARFMAIRLEDDQDSDYIPVIKQTGSREFEVPYFAAFRANYFWRTIDRLLKNPDRQPLFHLEFTKFTPPVYSYDFKLDPIYTLRSYQEQGMAKWEEHLFYGTIELPTGSGKTLLGIDAINKIRQRTLILVPNLALVEQWVNQIRRFLGIENERIGIFNGEKKVFKDRPIVISTYQLLSQYLQDYHSFQKEMSKESQRDKSLVEDTIGFFSNKFGLVIADEAHHIQAETFRHIAVDLEIPRRMALSATIEKSVHSSLVVATMGPIIYKIGYGLLAREGYIAPIYYKPIYIPLTEYEKNYVNKKGKKSHGKVSREAANKYIAILKLLQSPLTNKTLIFTSRINHATKIHKFLKENGIESTLLTGDTVLNDKELNNILDQFRKGKINTLVLVKMLNEGFDAPADTVIVVSGTRNRREQIQRFGRATRPGKVAKLFELIIDPMELEYENEVATARDITDIIEPHVQDLLLPKDLKHEIDKLVSEIRSSFYEKGNQIKKEYLIK